MRSIAAHRLLSQSKWSEAVASLDEMLRPQELHTPADRVALCFCKGYALEQLNQHEHALSAYSACETPAAAASAPHIRVLATWRRASLLVQLARWDEAERELRRCVDDAKAISDEKLHLGAIRLLAMVYRNLGQPQVALAWMEEALHSVRPLGDEAAEATTLDEIGDMYTALSQVDEALRSYERSLDLFRKLGAMAGEQMVKQDIGVLYQVAGEWEKAIAWYQACLREAMQAGHLDAQARFLYEMACLQIHMEKPEAAARLLLQSMGRYREAEDRAGTEKVARTLIGLGVSVQREATAGQLTFRDIERGAAKK